MIDVARRAEELVADLVEAEGYELVHVEYVARGTSPILRVYVDRPGGITISECAEVSRRISVLLDVEDFIPNQYLLEVSSPGLERPLFKERDFQRFEGDEIRLTATEKIEGRRNFKGRIRKCERGVLTLDCENQSYVIPLTKVKKANLVYEFD